MEKNMDVHDLDILMTTSIFSNLDMQSFNLIASAMTKKMLDPGDILFRQDQTGDSLMIVTKGTLAIKFKRSTGKEFDIDTIGPGGVLGEMSCIDPAPRSASAVALEGATIYEMNRNLIRSLHDYAPRTISQIYSGITALVSERSRELEQRILMYLETIVSRKRVQIFEKSPGYALTDFSNEPPVQTRLSSQDISSMVLPKGFSQRDLETLAAAGTCMKYADGALLCREGDPGSGCYLLLKGELHIMRSVGQSYRLLSTLNPGTFLGQMALIDDTPRSATVQVKGESIVLMITRSDFNQLLKSGSHLGLKFQEQILVAGIRQHRHILKRLDRIHYLDGFSESDEAEIKTGKDLKTEIQDVNDESAQILKDYISSLKEWGITMDTLNDVKCIRCPGEINPMEIKARLHLKLE